MNVAYYVLVFDHATDALFDHVGLDEAYRKEHDYTTSPSRRRSPTSAK